MMNRDETRTSEAANTEQRSRESVSDAVDSATATAFHEAGHAVVAFSFGCQIKKVTITPGHDWLGQYRLGLCELQQGRSANARNRLDEQIVILFAGMVAEAHFMGRSCEHAASDDLRVIRRLLCDRAGSEKQHEKLHRRLLARTEHLMEDDGIELAVKMIADELLQKQTISGRAVRHFYDQAMQQTS